MNENENIHLYLCSFDKTTDLPGWPRENWMTAIHPFLNDKAQIAFKALPIYCSKDLERLKQAILKSFNSP